jgi:hypothetical protein
MNMAPATENLSAASAQCIPALAYIPVQVEQEAKNCEDQRSMPQLISFFFPIPRFQIEIYNQKYQNIGK